MTETFVRIPERAGQTMKALSLWQPWASLVALGVKTIETRSWATSYRGPLAIHAAKTADGFDELPGDCEGKTEGGWVYGYIGDFQAAYCRRTSDEGRRGEAEMIALEDGGPTGLESVPLPLGAVVATCTLVRCVPICAPAADTGEIPPDWALIDPGPEAGLRWTEPLSHSAHGWQIHQCEDQQPYGDFTPGRFAWLLADIEKVDPPVLATGKQGLWAWTRGGSNGTS